MTITTLPPAPSRADAANADTFSEIAETFVAALPVFSTQVNSTLTNVNAAAMAAIASANFKGSWASLTGAMSIPASALHEDTLWLLVTNTSNIAADEPGVSAKWIDLASITGYVSLTGNQTIAGNKTFTGDVSVDDLSATTGTFSGNVSSSGGVFTGDGSGLTDVLAVNTLGIDQSWVNFATPSQRAIDTVYQNTTSKPICVKIQGLSITSGKFSAGVRVGVNSDGSNLLVESIYSNTDAPSGLQNLFAMSVIVPPGHYYRCYITTGELSSWNELR